VPADDLWIMAVLNSPIGWWYAWRKAQHGMDEALRYFDRVRGRRGVDGTTGAGAEDFDDFLRDPDRHRSLSQLLVRSR
jgi:hypothetical protein